MKTLSFLLVLVAFTASTGTVLFADESDGWAFEIEHYMLASSIAGDTSLGRVDGVDVDVDFSDILETLDIGAMIHFEAIRNNQWGIILDYGFMKLSDDLSFGRDGVIDSKLRQGVLEAFGLRRFDKGAGSLDLYGGVRWWDNDISVIVDPDLWPGTLDLEVSEGWIDIVIGGRWRQPIRGNWDLSLSGDIGGFGLESDFTAGATASVFYRFNPTLSLELAYGAVWVDYETGTPQAPGFFAYDTVTHGPVVGLVIGF